VNLFIYSFAVFGLAWVVGHSKISLPFRKALDTIDLNTSDYVRRFLLAMIECVGCFSFHVGWISWLVGIHLTGTWGPSWVGMIVAALYTATSSLVIGRFAGVVD
jgi:hypothetical protein